MRTDILTQVRDILSRATLAAHASIEDARKCVEYVAWDVLGEAEEVVREIFTQAADLMRREAAKWTDEADSLLADYISSCKRDDVVSLLRFGKTHIYDAFVVFMMQLEEILQDRSGQSLWDFIMHGEEIDAVGAEAITADEYTLPPLRERFLDKVRTCIGTALNKLGYTIIDMLTDLRESYPEDSPEYDILSCATRHTFIALNEAFGTELHKAVHEWTEEFVENPASVVDAILQAFQDRMLALVDVCAVMTETENETTTTN